MFARVSLRTFEHFVEVARLIAGDNAPEWLPRLLHSWMCDLHRVRFVDSLRGLPCARMRRRLDRFGSGRLARKSRTCVHLGSRVSGG